MGRSCSSPRCSTLLLKSAFRDCVAYKTPGKHTSERAVDPAVDSKVGALVGSVAATVVDDSANIRQYVVSGHRRE